MDLDAIKDTFFAECTEQLSELENGLFSLDVDDPDLEVVNSVFRAVHSIKGGAGAFSYDNIVNFAHVFENALDIIRNDLTQCTESRMELMMRSSDMLADIVNATRESGDPIDSTELASDLEREFGIEMEEEEDIEFDVVPISLDEFELGESEPDGGFEIKFAPKAEMYFCGHDPKKVLRELSGLGTIEVTSLIEDIPPLDKFDAKETHLSFVINLTSDKTIDEVNAVFEWVEDLCEFSVEAVGGNGGGEHVDIGDFLGDFDIDVEPDEDDDGAAQLAVEGGDVAEHEVETLETAVADTSELEMVASDEASIEPSIEVEAENAPEPVEAPAQEAAKTPEAAPKETEKKVPAKNAKPIRVDSEKVDRLINLMGELVISQSMLSLKISDSGFGPATPIGLTLVELQNLTRDIQSSVMAIRAQPIKPVFMRMSRVVREVASATGKKAKLVLEGEQTEVDTTVIEGLSDPLTHMIRNSVDHGIESPEDRVAAGKEELGTIKLSASHSSGRIVIDIVDDGAGINREKVLEKAIEKGIVSPEANLSDEEIDNLIFAPGFSTAEAITDVSGRGVGMDVVRNSIQSLGGRVSITSKPGKGSHFSLSLPLTLAILDGMLVQEADQKFVLPVNSIVETISLRAGDVFPIGEGQLFYKLRDQLVPIVDVGYEMGFADRRPVYDSGTILIVEFGKNSKCAFVVEAIVGQQQVVIKSMESNYQRIPSIAAATILGNGQIALILDVDEIVTRKVSEAPAPQALDMAG